MHFVYDGSFDGLLTTLRAIWATRAVPLAIRPADGAQSGLFAETIRIDTDGAVAAEVWQNLRRWVDDAARQRLYHVFLAEVPDSELLIYQYLQRAIAAGGRDLSEDYLDDTVSRVLTLSRTLGREKHRFEAFVRFEQAADGLFHATVNCLVNVLPLLAPHFTARYADQRWLLFDPTRHYGLYYDGHRTRLVTPDADVVQQTTARPVPVSTPATPATLADPQEPIYQHLWRTYYQNVDIAARRNPKLHKRNLPLRYWRYLTEKQPGPPPLLARQIPPTAGARR